MELPDNSGLTLLIVSHLDPKHECHLSDILGRASKMTVREISEGMRVEVDHVSVIPPGTSMALTDGHLTLTEGAAGHPAHAHRPPVPVASRHPPLAGRGTHDAFRLAKHRWGCREHRRLRPCVEHSAAASS
jgi:chemotaxis response regulator CheB